MTILSTLNIRRSIAQWFLLLFVCLFSTSLLFAQSEGTMYSMTGVPQSTNYNPAFMPKYKFIFSIGVASVHAHYSNSSFSYNDVVIKRGDSSLVDLNRLNAALKDKNYITTAADAEVFRLGIKLGARLYFNTYVTAKAYNRLMLPKDLTGLFVSGTAAYVNSSASISPAIESMAYAESAIGFSYVATKKLNVGFRFKYLIGGTNVTTENSELNLAVSEDYALTATARVNAKTSGIQNIDDAEYQDYFKNNGFAIDLGASYKLTDKLTVAASLLEIGAITWKNDTYAYTMDPTKANYTFAGVDLQKILDGDEDYLDAEADSIESKFELEEGAVGKYRTPLPGKAYLSAQYDLKRNVSFGAVLMLEKFRGRFNVGLSGYAHKEFGRIVGASISLTATNRTLGNLGAGLNLNLSPFQFYVASDNLLRFPLSYLANGGIDEFAGNVQYINVRAGLNFVFGRIKTQEKLAYNKRKR
jgi:hypothetical protein